MNTTHSWSTVSSHHSAEGPVRYQRCACGAWRTLVGREPVSGADGRCRRLASV